MNVLVDTSIWSLALRRRPRVLNALESALVDELKELIREGRTRIIGPIRQELLSGIRSREQLENLRADLRSFPDEPIQTHDYEMAAEAGNECRSKGIAVSLVDALICTIAIGRGWPVFSTDPDFRAYSRVLPLVLHMKRGS